MFLAADHELFSGSVMEAINRVAAAALGGNHDKNRQYEKSGGGHTGNGDKNCVHSQIKLATLYFHYSTDSVKSQSLPCGCALWGVRTEAG